MSSYRPVVISGPSGVGKSTLLKELFVEYPDTFAFSVSHTTRKPRDGEKAGEAYHFVERQVFQEMIKNKGFLEHAEFSSNLYGTSKKAVSDIQESGRICILDVEINGVKNIKLAGLDPPPRYVFIKPKSFEVLKERLEGRGSENPESLKKRLDSAKEAMDYAEKPDSYDHVIVNDDLTVAYKKLKEILIEDITALNEEKLKAGK